MVKEPAIAFLEAVDPLLLQPQYAIFGRGLKIGRDSEQCEVILSRDYVSRQHCAFTVNGGDQVLLRDLGTTNGTYVNGQKVNQHPLREGDLIGLGKPSPHQFVFSRLPERRVRRYVLGTQKHYLIGRAPECDLPLPQDPTVSAGHARLRVEQGALFLEDLASANGSFVNGASVRRAAITPHDEVQIGSSRLSFSLTAEGLLVRVQEQRNQVRLETRGLGRVVKGRRLLQDINLVLHPGEYVGVLGPSGAGKSTFLNALNGFQPATEGQVLLNQVSLYSSYDMFRNSIGYVPQDDIIYPELSVERSLLYTARLRLPSDVLPAQVEEQVTSVIETLGLGHVRHNPVARLSGGQRKRVSIGCELLTKPSLLFLDEPTSGLDPSTEEKLMKHFRRMSEQGQTIILTTHILYSLDLVDMVVLLAKGRLVYFGPVRELCGHFSTADRSIGRPIEIFDLLEPEGSSMEERDKLAQLYADKYRQSQLHENFVTRRAEAAAVPCGDPAAHVREAEGGQAKKQRRLRWKNVKLAGRQLLILTQRALDLKLSIPSRLLVPLLVPALLALLNLTFAEQVQTEEQVQLRERFLELPEAAREGLFNPAFLTPETYQSAFLEGWRQVPFSSELPLMMIMAAVFLGTLTACLEISGERPIYLRERSVNLRIYVYVASKLPALFLFSAFQSFIYVSMTAVLLGLGGNGINVLALVLICFWVSCISAMVGLLISSLDPTAGSNSVVLAVVAVLPQLIFSGAIAPDFYGEMAGWAKGIANVLPARWGYEMLLTAFYQSPAWARHLVEGAPPEGMGFAFGTDRYVFNSLMLAFLGLVYYSLTCLSLRRYDRL